MDIFLGLVDLSIASSLLTSWYERHHQASGSAAIVPDAGSGTRRDLTICRWDVIFPVICGGLLTLPLVTIGLEVLGPRGESTLQIAAAIGLVSAGANGIVFLLNAAIGSIVSPRG